MEDEYPGGPSEEQVADWNEHNDHADEPEREEYPVAVGAEKYPLPIPGVQRTHLVAPGESATLCGETGEPTTDSPRHSDCGTCLHLLDDAVRILRVPDWRATQVHLAPEGTPLCQGEGGQTALYPGNATCVDCLRAFIAQLLEGGSQQEVAFGLTVTFPFGGHMERRTFHGTLNPQGRTASQLYQFLVAEYVAKYNLPEGQTDVLDYWVMPEQL